MIKYITSQKSLLSKTLIIASAAFLTISCSKDKPSDEQEPDGSKSKYFISTNQLADGNAGSTYILTAKSLSEGKISAVGQGFPLTNAGHVWYNISPSRAIGFVYVRGAQNFGDVLGIKNNTVVPIGEGFTFPTRFNSYSVANGKALASSGGLADQKDLEKQEVKEYIYTVEGESGVPSAKRSEVVVSNIHAQGEFFSFAGFTASSDGKIFSGVVPSKIEYESTGGGSAVGPTDYPDKVFVVRLNAALNKIDKVYEDDRLSYAAGRRRSQNLQHVFADGNYVYVFSNSVDENTTKTPGVLRINLTTDEFDPSWKIDLTASTKTNGHYFWRVMPVGNGYYMLDFYTEPGERSLTGTGKFAILNINTQDLKWVTGLPTNLLQNSNIYPPMPYLEDGKAFIPIMSADNGQLPAIYEIDPKTATAKRGIEVEADYITGFGKLTEE